MFTMNFSKLFCLCCLIFSAFSFSQEIRKRDSIPAIQVTLLNTNYKDYIVIDKVVYAITKGDSLVIFNLQLNSIIKTIPNILAIGKTSKKVIFFVDEKMNIRKTTDFIKSDSIDDVKGKFPKIFFDKNDSCIIITSYEVFYKNKHHVPTKEFRKYRWIVNIGERENLLGNPSLVYVDQKERIWLTYDKGEFGHETCFFDLKSRSFFESDYLYLSTRNKTVDYYNSEQHNMDLLDSFPNYIKKVKENLIYKFPNNLPISYGVKGISENNYGEMLISQSLMHFSVDGNLEIYKESEMKDFYYSYNINQILEYKNFEGSKSNSSYLYEYIGYNNFNTFDNSFYYYSDKGFFKILKENEKYSKQFLFKPQITWTSGMSNAVGYEMNIKKFEFISKSELLFLTSNNGIGYFNGQSVKYFK